MLARWSVPIVGALVAIALLGVIVTSVRGDDEDADDGPLTTAEPVEDDAPLASVDQICAEQLPALLGPIQQAASLGPLAAAATDPAQLNAVAAQAEADSQELLEGAEQLSAAVAAAPVEPEAIAQRDAIAAALGEITFTIGAFTNRALEVLRSGDPATVEGYGEEAQTSLLGLISLVQRMNEAAGADAPSCVIELPEVVALQPPAGQAEG